MRVYKTKVLIEATVEVFVEAESQDKARQYIDAEFDKRCELYTVFSSCLAPEIQFGKVENIKQADSEKPLDLEDTGWKGF